MFESCDVMGGAWGEVEGRGFGDAEGRHSRLRSVSRLPGVAEPPRSEPVLPPAATLRGEGEKAESGVASVAAEPRRPHELRRCESAAAADKRLLSTEERLPQPKAALIAWAEGVGMHTETREVRLSPVAAPVTAPVRSTKPESLYADR